MHIEGIDHIGIASKDPARTRWFFSTALQLNLLDEESIPSQLVDTVMWSSVCLPTHGEIVTPRLELLLPSSPASTVAKFIAKRGGGVHHLSFRVRDLDRAIDELRRKGVRFVSDTPQHGFNNSRIIFIHPHSTGGLLVELTSVVSDTR